MPKLSGADYVAETAIFVRQGDQLVRVADVGQTCEKVPAESLEGLAGRHKIKRIVEPPKKGKKE